MDSLLLVRRVAKAAALPLSALGATGRRLSVLIYHRVGAGSREIDLPRDRFELQMQVLSHRGGACTLDDGLAGRGDVVVSVDDGFSDFYECVLPVIERLRIPVILYLATGFVAGEELAGPASLTWGQLAEAVSTGLVEVGSHTHTHADLSRCGHRRALEEMRRSKGLIEDRLGVPCRHFAYPWSYSSPGAREAAAALFDSAALLWRTNRLDRLDPQRLGRTPVLRSDGDLFFRAKLDGRLDHEATVYRLLRRGPWRSS